MKKLFVLFASMYVSVSLMNAQKEMRPFTGNGQPKTVNYALKSFTDLEILWIDGKIEVEYGSSQSDISIATDENIYNMLLVENTEGVLKLEFKNNYKNRLWVEDDKTTIKIRTTQQPRKIVYKANADATFKGIDANTLTIEKDGNGDVNFEGKVDNLNLTKSDNGSVLAEKLIAQNASLDCSGNGSVKVFAKNINKQSIRGNGGMMNAANASTNGANVNTLPVKRINVTFHNPSVKRKEFYVSGRNERGGAFSYGLGLESMSKKKEYLPIGTKVYFKGKLVTTLKNEDDNKVVNL
jgi:hypothetical protein